MNTKKFISIGLEKEKSNCCNAYVGVSGEPDFFRSEDVCTRYYVCEECGNPCDIK